MFFAAFFMGAVFELKDCVEKFRNYKRHGFWTLFGSVWLAIGCSAIIVIMIFAAVMAGLNGRH